MNSNSWPIRLLAVMLLVPAFACADKEEVEVDITPDPEEAPAPSMAPVTVMLQPMGGSMTSGEVVATHGPENVNVRVSVAGLAEGKDYEAKLRYGMCADAQAHFEAAKSLTESTPGTPGTTHDVGDEFGEMDVAVTGTTGTGSTEIDLDELRATEPAYVAIEIDDDLGTDDQLLACADLTGHSGMGTGTSTTPGAPTMDSETAPAEPGRD